MELLFRLAFCRTTSVSVYSEETPGTKIECDMNSPTWHTLARIAMLCNRAEFKKEEVIEGEEPKNIPVLRRSISLSLSLSVYITVSTHLQ